MTRLGARDRLWRGFARHIDRPALALIGAQPVLRRLFAVSARLGSALPPASRRPVTPPARSGFAQRAWRQMHPP